MMTESWGHGKHFFVVNKVQVKVCKNSNPPSPPTQIVSFFLFFFWMIFSWVDESLHFAECLILIVEV